MDPELRRLAHGPDALGTDGPDWVGAQADLDDCDGYIVLAYDPQTGEVDAHGPFVGLRALDTAEAMRNDLDREDLGDVVVRVVRWHRTAPTTRAA